jgi:hypothetical protein
MGKKWSYGYSGPKETRSVLITQLVAHHLGLKAGTIIHFDGPPVRTAKDMSQEEIAAIESQYGCPVDGGRYQWGL